MTFSLCTWILRNTNLEHSKAKPYACYKIARDKNMLVWTCQELCKFVYTYVNLFGFSVSDCSVYIYVIYNICNVIYSMKKFIFAYTKIVWKTKKRGTRKIIIIHRSHYRNFCKVSLSASSKSRVKRYNIQFNL